MWNISTEIIFPTDTGGKEVIRRLQKEDLPSLSSLFKQFWNEESPVDAMQKQFEHMIKEGNYVLPGGV